MECLAWSSSVAHLDWGHALQQLPVFLINAPLISSSDIHTRVLCRWLPACWSDCCRRCH